MNNIYRDIHRLMWTKIAELIATEKLKREEVKAFKQYFLETFFESPIPVNCIMCMLAREDCFNCDLTRVGFECDMWYSEFRYGRSDFIAYIAALRCAYVAADFDRDIWIYEGTLCVIRLMSCESDESIKRGVSNLTGYIDKVIIDAKLKEELRKELEALR